jgi:hypothetical protein
MDHIPESKIASEISIAKEKVSFNINNAVPNLPIFENLKSAVPAETAKVLPSVLPTVPEPVKSAKHENAIVELKTYISTVLQSKLDEISHSVTQRISEQEHLAKKIQAEELKRGAQAPAGKGKK